MDGEVTVIELSEVFQFVVDGSVDVVDGYGFGVALNETKRNKDDS